MTKLEGTQLCAYYAHRLNINKIAQQHLAESVKSIKSAGALILNGKIDVQFAVDSVQTIMDEVEKLIADDTTQLQQLSEVTYD